MTPIYLILNSGMQWNESFWRSELPLGESINSDRNVFSSGYERGIDVGPCPFAFIFERRPKLTSESQKATKCRIPRA